MSKKKKRPTVGPKGGTGVPPIIKFPGHGELKNLPPEKKGKTRLEAEEKEVEKGIEELKKYVARQKERLGDPETKYEINNTALVEVLKMTLTEGFGMMLGMTGAIGIPVNEIVEEVMHRLVGSGVIEVLERGEDCPVRKAPMITKVAICNKGLHNIFDRVVPYAQLKSNQMAFLGDVMNSATEKPRGDEPKPKS